MTLFFSILLTLFSIVTLPIWPHSLNWGYYLSGGAGFLLILLVFYALLR